MRKRQAHLASRDRPLYGLTVAELEIDAMSKQDFDTITSVLDRWWGGPAGQRADPPFFYELGAGALVARQDGQIAGFLLGFVAPLDPPIGYIHLVGIHPDQRRRAVGKRLYERFIDNCHAQGITQLKAISPVGDEGALRFHVALGFEAQEVSDYAGPGRARVVYTRSTR
ncbi:MAG: GNAT family N-acetyltransferase [Myxococcota bacterium]